MSKLSSRQETSYLKHPTICPYCRGADLFISALNRENDNQIQEEVECKVCAECWTNVYTLTGIIPEDHGEIKVEIIQPRLSKYRRDSFWYDGQVALVSDGENSISVDAIGEINVFFTPDGDIYRGDAARAEALRRKLGDKRLEQLSEHDGWQNNNWFGFFHIEKEQWTADIAHDYNMAIEVAKEILQSL